MTMRLKWYPYQMNWIRINPFRKHNVFRQHKLEAYIWYWVSFGSLHDPQTSTASYSGSGTAAFCLQFSLEKVSSDHNKYLPYSQTYGSIVLRPYGIPWRVRKKPPPETPPDLQNWLLLSPIVKCVNLETCQTRQELSTAEKICLVKITKSQQDVKNHKLTLFAEIK